MQKLNLNALNASPDKETMTYTLSKRDYEYLTTWAKIGLRPFPWKRLFFFLVVPLMISFGIGLYLNNPFSDQPRIEENVAALKAGIDEAETQLSTEERIEQIVMEYHEYMTAQTVERLRVPESGVQIRSIRGPGIYDIYVPRLNECHVVAALMLDGRWTSYSLSVMSPNVVCN